MEQDAHWWFAVVCPPYSLQFNTYSKMSVTRNKIAMVNEPWAIVNGGDPEIVLAWWSHWLRWELEFTRSYTTKCWMAILTIFSSYPTVHIFPSNRIWLVKKYGDTKILLVLSIEYSEYRYCVPYLHDTGMETPWIRYENEYGAPAGLVWIRHQANTWIRYNFIPFPDRECTTIIFTLFSLLFQLLFLLTL